MRPTVNTLGPSDDARSVEIWLQGLTPGQSYVAQIRVVAGQGGEFHVRTSNEITNIGDSYYWAFVDVTITAI